MHGAAHVLRPVSQRRPGLLPAQAVLRDPTALSFRASGGDTDWRDGYRRGIDRLGVRESWLRVGDRGSERGGPESYSALAARIAGNARPFRPLCYQPIVQLP